MGWATPGAPSTSWRRSLDSRPVSIQQRFREVLTAHGLVLAGQSETLVPADRKLYALRDATATVPSIPLISSSIMSKKLAEGLDGLLLDVKTGSGAFMKDLEKSRELAHTMVGIGIRNQVKTVALITRMDQPLGREVGNANEMRESIDVLNGGGPPDVVELTLAFGEVMLELAGESGGRDRLTEAIANGSARQKLIDVVAAQGGDTSVIDDPSLLPTAPNEDTVTADRDGYVTRCDALVVGIGRDSPRSRTGAQGGHRRSRCRDHGAGQTRRAGFQGSAPGPGSIHRTCSMGCPARNTRWSLGRSGPNRLRSDR